MSGATKTLQEAKCFELEKNLIGVSSRRSYGSPLNWLTLVSSALVVGAQAWNTRDVE